MTLQPSKLIIQEFLSILSLFFEYQSNIMETPWYLANWQRNNFEKTNSYYKHFFKFLFQSPFQLHEHQLDVSRIIYLLIFCTLSSDNKLGLVDHKRTQFTAIILFLFDFIIVGVWRCVSWRAKIMLFKPKYSKSYSQNFLKSDFNFPQHCLPLKGLWTPQFNPTINYQCLTKLLFWSPIRSHWYSF